MTGEASAVFLTGVRVPHEEKEKKRKLQGDMHSLISARMKQILESSENMRKVPGLEKGTPLIKVLENGRKKNRWDCWTIEEVGYDPI